MDGLIDRRVDFLNLCKGEYEQLHQDGDDTMVGVVTLKSQHQVSTPRIGTII